MHPGHEFALGKSPRPEEFAQATKPEHRRGKAAYRPLGKFIPNPKLKLREQVAEVCRFRHLSVRTEGAYWDWIRRFLVFHQPRPGVWRHPREMGAPEVSAFLSHLASERKVAASTQLYTHVMQKPGLG